MATAHLGRARSTEAIAAARAVAAIPDGTGNRCVDWGWLCSGLVVVVTAADVLAGKANWAITCADVMDGLAQLPDGCVHTVVTSPPYFGLRDYGTATWSGGDAACTHRKILNSEKAVRSSGLDGSNAANGHQQEGFKSVCSHCGARRIDKQTGLEPTIDDYVARMVEVFAEVKRVLRPDGTLWLNLGDLHQNKQLLGMPWRVAFALQAAGWWLRSDIIWSKPNPMPESATDRPTRSHEYLFLLSKRSTYYYDADAIREEATHPTTKMPDGWDTGPGGHGSIHCSGREHGARVEKQQFAGRNKRSVWTIATEGFAGAHFACFPTALVEPCILAGTSEHGVCPACGAPWRRVVERTAMVVRPGPSRVATRAAAGVSSGSRTAVTGTMLAPPTMTTTGWAPTCTHDLPPRPALVLDPFSGAATTGLVALRLGRRYIGIELSPAYVAMSKARLIADHGLEAERAHEAAGAAQLRLFSGTD